MECPKCGSSDTYNCPTAYEHGTTHTSYGGSATTRSDGPGYDANQRTSYSSGSISSQTAFAKRASPPSKRLMQGPLIVFLAILYFAVSYLYFKDMAIDRRIWDSFVVAAGFIPNANDLIDLEYQPGRGVLVIAALIAAAGVFLLAYRIVTLPVWFVSLLRWKRSWICGRCSTVFVPASR